MTRILEYSKSCRSLTLRNIDRSGFSIIAREDIHVDEGDIKKIGNLFESIGIPFRIAEEVLGSPASEIITLELFRNEAERIIDLLTEERLRITQVENLERIYKTIIVLDNIQKKIERGIEKSQRLGQ